MKHDWQLTPRQMKVLSAIREGLSNKEIATRMGIAERTVKFHCGQIYRKFGIAQEAKCSRVALLKIVGFHKSRAK